MDYTKSQKKYYCQEENDGQQGLNLATFERDITLPSLPVPSLQESIAKYLKSIQPFVDQDEFQRSENICADFLNQEISSKLQNELLQRAKVSSKYSQGKIKTTRIFPHARKIIRLAFKSIVTSFGPLKVKMGGGGG